MPVATFLDLHRPTRLFRGLWENLYDPYLNGQIYKEPHHFSELIIAIFAL